MWLLAFFSVNGSRGSVIDKAEDLQKISEGFGVFGNYKEAESQEFGSNWFNNVKVTYSSPTGALSILPSAAMSAHRRLPSTFAPTPR